MSKENTTNGILEETSPNAQTTNDTSNGQKSLEQIEKENLEAISKGELSETAINYANYTNKPNKIIENSSNIKEENPLLAKSVVKIDSRPDSKELRKRRKKKKVSNEKEDITKKVENKTIKIDSKSDKVKSELQDLSNDDNPEKLDISEKFNLAKAKRNKQINELNANLVKPKINSRPIKETPVEPTPVEVENSTPVEEPPKIEITQTITKKPKKDKKSLKERLENYFFIPEDDETSKIDDKTSTEKKSKINLPKFKKTSQKVEKPTEDTPVTEVTKREETPKVKQKVNIKAFAKSLFLGDDYIKKDKPKKEPFKQRMLDFFCPEEVIEDIPKVENIQTDTPIIEETPKVEEIQTETPIIEETPKVEEIQAETPIIEETSKVEDIQIEMPIMEETPKVEDIQTETPIMEETPKVEDIKTDTPIIEETPKVEKIKIDTPIMEETPKVEDIKTDTPIIEETPKVEKIKIDTPIIEETPKVEEIKIDTPIIEETPKVEEIQTETPIIEETPKVEEIQAETPIIEETPKVEEIQEKPEKKLSAYRRLKNFFLSEELEQSQPTDPEPVETEEPPKAEEPTPTEETYIDDDNLIMPFNEDTPSEAIDIPIDEPPRYKHFWQDPDFSIIDRIKTYQENYKNRKRSGEFHMEIKSTPDTAMLIRDLDIEKEILKEEELSKSREEYQKQVLNGEYDGFEENPKKVEEEPVFQKNSVSDFNSYEDCEKVKNYISDMSNSLMVRMVITILLAVISFYITIANDLELPLPDTLNVTTSASGYLLVQSILGLLTIITSIKAVFSGIVKIFKGQSDCDSLASMGLVFGFISTVLAYIFGQSLVEDKILNVYMCIGIIGMLCNLWGKSLILKREGHNFRYISRKKEKFGLFCMQDNHDAENITEGLIDDFPVTAYNRKSHFAKDFIKYTYSRDMADKFSMVAVPVIMGVSILVSLIAGIVYSRTFDMQIPVAITSILSMLMSFCSCFSISIGINSMLNDVSQKYSRRGGVLLGYQAVEDFFDTNSIVLSANDIFPENSIKLNAMKLFANGKLDETLIYAISLANKCNSVLAPTLMKIVQNKTDFLNEVEDYSYKDGCGICGWIDKKRILMGNRKLMEAHNIENLPSISKEREYLGENREVVYISISGNLALMLIVEISPSREVKRYLQKLEENNIAVAVTSSDFLVSESRINSLFDIDIDMVKVIPDSVYQENKEYFNPRPKCSTSIVTNGDINVLTDLLILTKKIHRNALIGNLLYAVACILGVLIGISFITMGAFKELNPTMILFYNGVCTLITILLTRLKV